MTTPTRLLAAVGLAVAAPAAPADELIALDGRRLTGRLVAVGPQAVTFRAADGADRAVPAKEVSAVVLGGPPAAAGNRDEVELTDGSVVRCTGLAIKAAKVEPQLTGGPPGVPPPAVDLPLAAVQAVVRDAGDPQARADWRRLLAARGKRDLFVVRTAGGLNPLAGTVAGGTDSGDAVRFERETDGRVVTLKLSRATGGLLLNPPPRGAVPPTVCKVDDAFGNRLYAAAVELSGGGLTVRTVSGAAFAYPALAGVAKLDFAEGNVTYLSDLAAGVDYRPDPVLRDLSHPLLADRTPDGPGLRVGSTTYPKGLSVAPDAVLTFPLNDGYREFRAVAGVDERAAGEAAVRFTVQGDGRVLYAGTAGPAAAIPLTLDVRNVKELRVVCEPTADEVGRLVLADARVQK